MNRIKGWRKPLCSLMAALFALLLVCLFPCVSVFAGNAGEARPGDMLFFLKIFLASAGVLLVLCLILFRNISRAGFMACLGMLVVINFSMAADALPIPGKVLLGILAVLAVLLSILLLKKKPDLTVGCVLIAIAFGAMCLVNLAMAVPVLLSQRNSGTVTVTDEVPVLRGEKRNVYFLLFDEYGGDENLRHYYDYDNSEFWTALEEMGFAVSHTSKNTESCWTDTLIPNLMNLDYVADDSMTELQRRSFLEQPLLYRLFAGNGYRIQLINHRDFLSSEGVEELTAGQAEDSISEYLLNRSIFAKIEPLRFRIAKQLWRNYRDQYQEPIENCFDCLAACADTALASGRPTLTVSYIQCPHSPFLYQKDGTLVETIARWNWKDGGYYTEQLTWLNGILLDSLSRIREKDPEAVILLLSDHGARKPMHMVEQYGGPRFDAEAETPYMQNILCCAFTPEEMVEVEGETGINAIRLVLNAAFDAGFERVPPIEGYVAAESTNAAE